MNQSAIKTFEDLRTAIWESKQHATDMLIDQLEESTKFQRGWFYGEIFAYNEILDLLRNIIKYGDCNE